MDRIRIYRAPTVYSALYNINRDSRVTIQFNTREVGVLPGPESLHSKNCLFKIPGKFFSLKTGDLWMSGFLAFSFRNTPAALRHFILEAL